MVGDGEELGQHGQDEALRAALARVAVWVVRAPERPRVGAHRAALGEGGARPARALRLEAPEGRHVLVREHALAGLELRVPHGDEDHFLRLFRELLGDHFRLEAPEEPLGEEPLELAHAALPEVALGAGRVLEARIRDGLGVVLLEVLLAAHLGPGGEVEHAPELPRVVGHGRAREQEAPPDVGARLVGPEGAPRRARLELVRLVKEDHGHLVCARQRFQVLRLPQLVDGAQEHVHTAVRRVRDGLRLVCAVGDRHAEAAPRLHLPPPVVQHRLRRKDERQPGGLQVCAPRPGLGCRRVGARAPGHRRIAKGGDEEGDGLHRLAQAHVVREDGTLIRRVSRPQELEALHLVLAQVLAHVARHDAHSAGVAVGRRRGAGEHEGRVGAEGLGRPAEARVGHVARGVCHGHGHLRLVLVAARRARGPGRVRERGTQRRAGRGPGIRPDPRAGSGPGPRSRQCFGLRAQDVIHGDDLTLAGLGHALPQCRLLVLI
mmetsp:Transcript_4200/g.14043  ORF Transcript_4200/g.14043 Transcript_4200/m.14043 type:complete len:491 (-) Transcript_4200:257-1729(-)